MAWLTCLIAGRICCEALSNDQAINVLVRCPNSSNEPGTPILLSLLYSLQAPSAAAEVCTPCSAVAEVIVTVTAADVLVA